MKPSKKLGELLVEREWLTREQVLQAVRHQQVFGGRLGTCLLELGLLPEERLLKALADQLGVPAASADDLRSIGEGILELIPAKLACRSKVVPFERFGNSISVAMLDTRDLLLQDELGFVVSKRLKIHVAPELRLLEALEKHYGFSVDARFSRIWDRLNRARYLWQEETAAGVAPGASRRGKTERAAAAPAAARDASGSWQIAPPPPLESGVTRLARAGVQVAPPPAQAPAEAPAAAPPTESLHPAPDVAPTPSPLLRRAPGAAPAPVPPASSPGPGRPGPQPTPEPQREDPGRGGGTRPAAEAKPTEAKPGEPPPASPGKGGPRASSVETTPLVVPPAPTTVGELQQRIAEVEDRDDVAHAVLSFLERRFQRRLLFMVRGSTVAAWMGGGDGVDQRQLASFQVGFDEPSLFLNLREGSPFYRGPLPRLDAHQRLVRVWGGKYPRECLLLPVKVKSRLVGAVYCDRVSHEIAGVDIGELQAVAAAMGRALETYLAKKKQP